MRVLFIVHGFPPTSCGGTELYALALAKALRSGGDEVAVLARQANANVPEYAVSRDVVDGVPVARINNTFLRAQSFEDTYRDVAIESVAQGEIEALRPDVVHVHHLTGLGMGLVPQCRRQGIPVVVTLQDYWLLCHRGQLLDLDLARCNGPEGDRCSACAGLAASGSRNLHAAARALRSVERRLPPAFAATHRAVVAAAGRAALRRANTRHVPNVGPPHGATALRLGHGLGVLTDASCLLAPSQTLFDRFARFGAPTGRMRRQEQGIDLASFRALVRQPDARLRIGFTGSLMVSKAPHLAIEAVAGLPRERVTLTVAGGLTPYHGDDSYAGTMRPLLHQPGVKWLGSLAHTEVPSLLSSLDVLVVSSVWIENAPFVIREAWAAGVVVVASRLGGMAEMVTDGRDGLLFEPGSAPDLRRVLSRLLDEPGLLDRLRRGIRQPRSIEDDAAWTREVYADVEGGASKVERSSEHDHEDDEHERGSVLRAGQASQKRAASVAGVVLNYRTPDDTLLAVRSLEASRRRVAPVVVVDNDTGGECGRVLAAGRATADLVEAGANLGFSGGCNVGITRALETGADLVLLLNSDAVLAPDAVAHLEEAMAASPRAGIAAPVVLSRAEPGVVSSAGILFASSTGRMRHEGVGLRAEELAREPMRKVTAASGCAMLIRREVFESVGLLDERYFFSFEDIDFCCRAAAAGWETWLVPSARVYHEGHRSIGAGSAARLYFSSRNHLLLARTVAPAPWTAAAARGAAIVFLNAAYAARTRRIHLLPGILAVARGTVDHLRGRYGPDPQVNPGARPG